MQLQAFFKRIDENASPLTEELYRAIAGRARELQRLAEQDREQRERFMSTTSVREWSGLVRERPTSALDRQRTAFINEWFETLQILRDIATRISQASNRPPWLPATVPSGAQADQFLHAHYYNRVSEGRQSRYAEQFDQNRGDPELAFTKRDRLVARAGCASERRG
jgi:hypothetical protein